MVNDRLAAAYVRGFLSKNNDFLQSCNLPERCIISPINELNENDIGLLLEYGKMHNLKMYYFKDKEDLPRVKKALGFLKAIYPTEILDVGSGRGVFLFPFLREFPFVPVTSIDILPHRVEFLNTIIDGGLDTLTAEQENICTWHIPSNSFDVVTMLEVLEHIPDVEKAAANAYRIAKRFVIVSVPSKPDNNPEHIHLLTKERICKLFGSVGTKNIKFDGVNGHLFAVIKKDN